jgi:hypothetical protein
MLLLYSQVRVDVNAPIMVPLLAAPRFVRPCVMQCASDSDGLRAGRIHSTLPLPNRPTRA